MAGAQAKQGTANAVVDGITKGLEAVGGLEAIEQGLNKFMEGMPVLMNALDEVTLLFLLWSVPNNASQVAKLHPFIGGMWPLSSDIFLSLRSNFSCSHGIQGMSVTNALCRR